MKILITQACRSNNRSNRARDLAIKNECFIGFVYDKKGKEIYKSKNDTRTVLIDLETNEITSRRGQTNE